MIAMDSSMQAKGTTHTADNSAPGSVGCPAAANAAQGADRAQRSAQANDNTLGIWNPPKLSGMRPSPLGQAASPEIRA